LNGNKKVILGLLKIQMILYTGFFGRKWIMDKKCSLDKKTHKLYDKEFNNDTSNKVNFVVYTQDMMQVYA
jgi:hypothetical protein